MSTYNINIKGNQFHPDKGATNIKGNFSNFDILNFTNDDAISPIINIYNIKSDYYKLYASSGYISQKGRSLLNYNDIHMFSYTLVYPGSYEAFIVNPTFIKSGYSFKVKAD